MKKLNKEQIYLLNRINNKKNCFYCICKKLGKKLKIGNIKQDIKFLAEEKYIQKDNKYKQHYKNKFVLTNIGHNFILSKVINRINKYLLIAFILFIIEIFFIYELYFIPNSLNELGDWFSGIFTLLAFLCASIAIYQQSRELSLQREELKQTRKELEGQKEQFQIQNQTLKRQQFENTFFNMLKTQENIINCIKIDTGETARKAIRKIAENFVGSIDIKWNDEKKIIDFYSQEGFLFVLDHYYRHLYRIIKFVHETDFSFCLDEQKENKTEEEQIKTEKYKYTSILRSTLSCDELVLLFYNALCYPKMKELIIDYSFLQNIRIFSNTIQHFKYYKDKDFKAFGNRKEEIKKELQKSIKK